MNVSDFKQLLQNPNTALSPSQTRGLETILEEYPYFQAARALHLKGLKNLGSYKYNSALRVTAAHTTDRETLFDYITSSEFVQDPIANILMGNESQLTDKETVSEEIEPNPDTKIFLGESEKAPLPQNIGHAEKILDPELFDGITKEEGLSFESDLQLGKPLEFTKTEKHSFSEWLQLTRKKPIPRETSPGQETLDKKKKFELLDKFIDSNPKIVPKETAYVKIDIADSVKIDRAELMTETLAKVYLEQKKFKKAIQAYKILSLKYPEKSGFFADRINAVKKLQKEKD